MKTICPQCMENAVITVDLDTGSDLLCTDCDAEYKLDDVRVMIASWGPLLVWLDAHPARTAPPAVGQ